jgi:hypothetical protein
VSIKKYVSRIFFLEKKKQMKIVNSNDDFEKKKSWGFHPQFCLKTKKKEVVQISF